MGRDREGLELTTPSINTTVIKDDSDTPMNLSVGYRGWVGKDGSWGQDPASYVLYTDLGVAGQECGWVSG